MGSVLSLRTGDAFDIFVQAEVESRNQITAAEYERSARYRVIEAGQVTREVQVDRAVDYYQTTMRYTFTNAKPEAVEVELTQGGLDYGWWARDFRVTAEDVPGEQLNAGNRLYRVSVPANGTRVVRVKYGVDEDVCNGDHACIRLSGCPTLTLKDNPDPLKVDPVATVIDGCVGCGLCGANAHAATLCPSFYRAEVIQNPRWHERLWADWRGLWVRALRPA